MALPVSQHSRYIRYLRELVQLRLAIEQNIHDVESSEQIVYVVDSNIIRLFLSPYQNWINVRPFREILGQEKELAGASAVVTAEYIFSRLLAQQRGYPVFLAPEHVDEVAEHFQRDRDDLGPRSQSLEQSEQWREARHALDSLCNHLLAKSQDADRLRELFESTIPSTIAVFDKGGFVAAQQFARLQRDDLIRPLRLAPHLDRRCLEVKRAGEYEEWRSTLAAFMVPESGKPNSRFGKTQSRDHSRDRILRRDAVVLTQLFAINDDLLRRKVPVKFVFVTDDDKIHHAVFYRRKYRDYGENLLRRSCHFHPALNFQQMPNIVAHGNLMLELKAAVNSLELTVSTEDTLYDLMHKIAVNNREGFRQDSKSDVDAWKATLQQVWQQKFETSFNIPEVPDIESSIRKVKAAWDGLSRNAISVNVELLSRRFEEELGPLSTVLKNLETSNANDLARAFESYQIAQIDVLERHHIEWCLAWLIADRTHLRSGYIPRGPLLFRLHKLGTQTDVDIEHAVHEIMKCTFRSESATTAVNRLLARYGFPDVVIVAAMVAYQHDDWSVAREFGERALERLRKALVSSTEPGMAARYKDNIRELEYLVALCQRLELCNTPSEHRPTDQDREALRQKFKFAERVNQNALLDCEERFDFFGTARANAELGILYLAGMAIDRLHPKIELVGSSKHSSLSRMATEHLRRASSDLDTYFPDDTNASVQSRNKAPTLAEDLYFNANVDLISAVTFFGVENLYKSKVPTALLQKALEFVRPRLERFPPHLAVIREICEWVQSEEDREKARLARNIIVQCDRLLHANDGGKSLTHLDTEMIQRYRTHIASWHNAAMQNARPASR
jgi:hypothetical protein